MAGVPSPVIPGPWELTTETRQEYNTLAHLKGWCHNSQDCAICEVEFELYTVRRTLDSIITGS